MNDSHYALVIGINEYPDAPSSYRLNGAVNDAKMVEQWLLAEQGGGIKPENCITLYHTPTMDDNVEGFPVRYHINETFKQIRKTLRKKFDDSQEVAGRFYFYFSGHGQALRLENDNILMCMANWGPDAPHANLSSRLVLKDYLERCLPCNELVFWTDCCRSRATDVREGFLDESCKKPWKEGFQPKLFWAGATLHETSAGEALDTNQSHSGYFTRALLEGLKSGKDHQGVSWDGLRDFLRQRVEHIAQQDNFPQRAEAHHNASPEQLYFGTEAERASLTIQLNGENRNLELLFNAVTREKHWPTASGTLQINDLKLGLYKLVDLNSQQTQLIDCSSPKEVVINGF